MQQEDLSAELFVRGFGTCASTTFAGAILGATHSFSHAGCQTRVSLPLAEFSEGSHDPFGASARFVHFRSGYVGQNYERSFYEVDRIYVEVDVRERVRIHRSMLDVDGVQKSPELIADYPHLETLSVKYEELASSAWAYWMRVARWAINEPLIGVPSWSSDGTRRLQMPRLTERTTRFSIWTSTGIIRLSGSCNVDQKRWNHIEAVLESACTPPVWFDYMVEAEQRFYNLDFSGCVLSSAIACETLARACYFYLIGTPIHPTAAEMVDRTAAQAIIGRWKKLTGIDVDGKVHSIFDTRNRLVHSGRADVIDESMARDTLTAAWTFVDGGDRWWFDQKGETNPRAEAAAKPES
jgi:hypothetical protein